MLVRNVDGVSRDVRGAQIGQDLRISDVIRPVSTNVRETSGKQRSHAFARRALEAQRGAPLGRRVPDARSSGR